MVVTHCPQPWRFTRAPYVEKLSRELAGAEQSPLPAPTMIAPESDLPSGKGAV